MCCIAWCSTHGWFEHCGDVEARRAVSQAEGVHKVPVPTVIELSREDIVQRLAIFGVQQAKRTDRGDLLSLVSLLDEDDPVRVARGTVGNSW